MDLDNISIIPNGKLCCCCKNIQENTIQKGGKKEKKCS